MRMHVEELSNGITLIRLEGDFDAKGAGEIETQFAAVTAFADKVVVDMQGVNFLASIGIRALLSAVKAVNRREGKLVVASVKDSVLQVLKTCGAHGVMTICGGLDEALAQIA